MIITPVNVSSITKAVETAFVNNHALKQARVERGGEVNRNPGLCPWIGIYRSDYALPSRTLGFGTGYRGQRVGLLLLVQEADASSGAACEDRLNALVNTILSSLLSEPTLGGAVNTLDEFNVRFPSYQRTDQVYMQTALVMFTAITTVGGNE